MEVRRRFYVLPCRGLELEVGKRTLIMGVLNLTPDSFSDGGLFKDVDSAVAHATRMLQEGADIVDVGGESTRPGAEPVSAEEELGRVEPVLRRLLEEVNAPVSIDTHKASVAERCLEMGAHIVNDVTALRGDERMVEVVKQYEAPVVLMHMKGTPRTMQVNPVYADVVAEIKKFLGERMAFAEGRGVSREMLILDPGMGFGKTTQHNLEIVRRLWELRELGCPVLVGPSRKSFIGDVLGLPVHERLDGTIATVVLCIVSGGDIVRVHDVKRVARAARLADAVLSTSMAPVGS